MSVFFVSISSGVVSYFAKWYVMEIMLVGVVLKVSVMSVEGLEGWWGMGFGFCGDSSSSLSVSLSLWVCSVSYSVGGFRASGVHGILVSSIGWSLVGCFFSGGVLGFYIFFEFVLIPMGLLIFSYGGQPERLESGSYLLFYTSVGSLPLLVGVVSSGTLKGSWSFMYSELWKSGIYLKESLVISMAFLIKLPSFGFHVWLPKAHVEAPVSGSMILAGVLLKMGGYGMLRMFPYLGMGMEKGVLISMGLYGGLLCGSSCLRQVDSKKMVAYSSVVHSGLMLGGMSGSGFSGWQGCLILMIGHGVCSSGLFYFVDVLYKRMYSRSMLMVKGVLGVEPGMMSWGFLLVGANSAAPPSLNMFGEIMLVTSILEGGGGMVILGCLLFVSVGYGVYFYSVLSQGGGSSVVSDSVKVMEYFILFLHLLPVGGLVLKSEMFN